MSDREKILDRIREALRLPALHPGAHGVTLDQATDASAREQPDFAAWLPLVGSDFDERAALFARNAEDLKAQFVLLDSAKLLPASFQQLADENGWKQIAAHTGELTALALRDNTLPVLRTDAGYLAADLEKCDAGLTECEALVAQTGSVLVSSRSSGGRALSVLPPHHVVVARGAQMLGDLPAAYALLQRKYGGPGKGYPSFISFITGPSRTGDIERILVLGAHGPKRLTIFCVP